MIYILLGVVVFFCILLLVGTLINSKFKLAIIKIEKAEEDIDIYLQKKFDLLSRAKAIVIKELKLESFLPEIDQNFSEISNFSENDILRKAYNDLLKTMDDHDKLLKSEALVSILEDLDQNEEDIVGAIKFYNDTVVDYNELVISFPSLILAFFKRYKKKDFYNNEKREMHNILS
ncbi:MAG: LemA family protein [Bacilli bacterium]|nr:LemA family protein [Bacilli bacterium]